ncbi:DUF2807 domain-containing protein [Photobacterium sp. 1_MG-2023]|uniref:GIN domain-containing protein n=1 Tax=Photobacterium sp. 1_MG-2023 TaxID=3062646 RepID=UPI0026E23D86|nr:DUF2807 domain-containing protein [Photobacterium sp. 1_MG-2023]MDO6708685.1 DUF2807 domain-containing protein [Photobacterium sp. 1_MG-2023]
MNQSAKKVMLPAALTGIVLLTAVIGGIPFSFAEDQTRTQSLDPFDRLFVEKGIEVNVHCGESNRLEATGENHVLEQMKLTERNGELSISNASGDDWEETDPLTLDLYTAQPLHRLEARFGIEAIVDSCAVAKDSFEAIGKMGSKLTLSGQTDKLTLELAMGATLTPASQPFKIGQADVKLGMGASASLCHAESITGEQSAGTRILVSPQAQTKLNSSYGTALVFDEC